MYAWIDAIDAADILVANSRVSPGFGLVANHAYTLVDNYTVTLTTGVT